jgi:hypothetical protein
MLDDLQSGTIGAVMKLAPVMRWLIRNRPALRVAQEGITLSGTLEFTTRDGESFVLRPGDVLLAADTTGTGHRWRLIDDQPWRRVYVEIGSHN